MNRKLCIVILSFFILIFDLTIPAIYAEEETEEQTATITAETNFGLEAAGEICTVRVFRPGADVENKAQEEPIYLNQGMLDDDGKISFPVIIRGESGTYPCIFRTESGQTRQCNLYYVSQEDEELLQTQESYYLLDEDFNMLRANAGDPLDLWGWDILEDGGEISYSNAAFWLNDTDSSKRFAIRRSFEPQSAGTVTLEFRFNQSTLQNDARWQMCGGETAVAELVTDGGVLYLNGKALQAYRANTEYGIRLELDLTLQTVSGYVNGACAGDKIPLLSVKTAVDNLRISTGAEATGRMNVKPIRLCRGYLAQEEWVSYTTGSLQSGAWQVSSDNDVRIEKMASTSPPDVYSVVLNDLSTSAESFIAKSLQNVPPKTVLEFKLYSEEIINDFTASLSDSMQLKIQENILYIAAPDGSLQQVTQLPVGLWNTVRVSSDSGSGRARLSVNGKKIANEFQCKSGTEASELRFSTGIAAVDKIWLDDIFLKRDLPMPSDYVPAPQTREKTEGESLVGIQTCDLWHEGKHFGWDKVNQDYRRKPYLGFYDDGSSEVKDWEIKFMAEHGIDFSLHCWYRPTDGMGSPIKTPRNGASIHDGYFNAQYRDRIKFAISWENGNSASTDETDFRTNIVPFWVEYYFKDPGYLVLDNKPVIGVYSITGLIESFGEENIKAQTDYLRQACREAGFDGAWVLGVSASVEADTLQKFADSGFDALYCYSWGTNGYQAESQKNSMTKQENAGIIPIIPTLAMGRDDTPWRRSSGGFLSPGELKSLAEWTKEEFQPQIPTDELGSRMILLDNWNEYGEGHFFMPAELSGFNYLEAIAQVYGAPQHTDVRPTQNQINRLCKLYPQDRTVPPMTEAEELPVNPNVVKGWYFDDGTEGFVKKSQILILSAQNGALSGYSTGTDPQFLSPDDLNIDISNVTHIRVRMRNNTDDIRSVIYFVTEQDSVYSETKKFSWVTRDCGEEFAEYIIPVYKNQYWNGTLKQLRFDPSMGRGSFAYDSIELLGGTDFVSRNLVLNGNMEQTQLPQSRGAVCEFTGWEFHGGIRSLLYRAETEEAELIYPVTLKGGSSYFASFYGRGADGNGSVELWMRYLQDGVLREEQFGDTLQLRQGEWNFAGSRLDLPKSEITDAQLIVKLKSADVACYLDDVMLYEIADPVLAVREARFTDESGAVLKMPEEADGTVIFTARLTNLSGEEIYVHPWLASYQDEILQAAVSGREVVLPAEESQDFQMQIEANQPTAIKQFFWNRELTPMKKFELMK